MKKVTTEADQLHKLTSPQNKMFSSGSIAAMPNLHFNPLHNSSALFQPNASGPLSNEKTPIKAPHNLHDIDQTSDGGEKLQGQGTIFGQKSHSLRPKMVAQLLDKVNMNEAFLGLAKDDQQLIEDMKRAITQLTDEGKKRELLYTAIEHNTKYLCSLAVKSDAERTIAKNQLFEAEENLKNLKIESLENARKMKQFQKDSETLTVERARNTQLTIDLTKAKEKEDNLTTTLKDTKRDFAKMKEEFETMKNKYTKCEKERYELAEKLGNSESELRETKLRLENADQERETYRSEADKYRKLMVEGENTMTAQAHESKEMFKKFATLQSENERKKEENAAYKKQNESLLERINEGQTNQQIKDAEKYTNDNEIRRAAGEPSYETLKEKVSTLQYELDQVREKVDKREADFSAQIAFNRSANTKLKDEHDLSEERHLKQKEMLEKIIADVRSELLEVKSSQKELQDFYDRYDAIIQEERTANMTQIKQINDVRDKQEQELRKKNEELDIELKTLKSEFTLRMQKIRLAELEVDNKLQADEANKIKQASEMKEMQTLVAMNEKTTSKLERKLASTKQQLEDSQSSAYQEIKELREEIKELKEQMLNVNIELEFERQKAAARKF